MLAAAPIVAITLLGAALRISQLDQSLYADELWSYVGATSPSLGGMLDFVRSDAEITPPLYTALAWASAKLGGEPETMIRLPVLIAGIATIPLTYLIGLRTLGRGVGLAAAALVALSPLLAFYSVEARAYALAVALVALSTLFMLIALERRTVGPWAAYAVCACAAMYAHYTSVYVLAAQFAWLLFFHPEARRAALLSSAAAALAFLPWLPGVLEDFGSPSQGNIGSLTPFTAGSFVDYGAATAFGHPARGLGSFLGLPIEIALAAGLALAAYGALAAAREWRPGRDGRRWIILFAMAAIAAPVGIAAASALGDDMYVPRNLASSWPAWALLLAALLTVGAGWVRAAALTLVLGAFAYGAIETTRDHWQRPAVQEAAEYVQASAGDGDVVLDAVGYSTAGGEDLPIARTFEIAYEGEIEPTAAVAPEEVRAAAAAAAGGRLIVVGSPFTLAAVREAAGLGDSALESARTFDGLLETRVEIYRP